MADRRPFQLPPPKPPSLPPPPPFLFHALKQQEQHPIPHPLLSNLAQSCFSIVGDSSSSNSIRASAFHPPRPVKKRATSTTRPLPVSAPAPPKPPVIPPPPPFVPLHRPAPPSQTFKSVAQKGRVQPHVSIPRYPADTSESELPTQASDAYDSDPPHTYLPIAVQCAASDVGSVVPSLETSCKPIVNTSSASSTATAEVPSTIHKRSCEELGCGLPAKCGLDVCEYHALFGSETFNSEPDSPAGLARAPVCCKRRRCSALAELPSGYCTAHQGPPPKPAPLPDLEAEVARLCCSAGLSGLQPAAQQVARVVAADLAGRATVQRCGAADTAEAVVLHAAGQCNVPLTLAALRAARPASDRRAHPHPSKVLERVQRITRTPLQPRSTVADFLRRYVTELRLPEHTLIAMQEVLARAGPQAYQGLAPQRVAAAVLLACCRNHPWLDSDGNRVKGAQVSEAVGIPLPRLEEWCVAHSDLCRWCYVDDAT